MRSLVFLLALASCLPQVGPPIEEDGGVTAGGSAIGGGGSTGGGAFGGGSAGQSCSDVMQNGSETDVDCGGHTCPACQFLTESGPQCAADSDCAGSFCSNDGVAPKR